VNAVLRQQGLATQTFSPQPRNVVTMVYGSNWVDSIPAGCRLLLVPSTTSDEVFNGIILSETNPFWTQIDMLDGDNPQYQYSNFDQWVTDQSWWTDEDPDVRKIFTVQPRGTAPDVTVNGNRELLLAASASETAAMTFQEGTFHLEVSPVFNAQAYVQASATHTVDTGGVVKRCQQADEAGGIDIIVKRPISVSATNYCLDNVRDAQAVEIIAGNTKRVYRGNCHLVTPQWYRSGYVDGDPQGQQDLLEGRVPRHNLLFGIMHTNTYFFVSAVGGPVTVSLGASAVAHIEFRPAGSDELQLVHAAFTGSYVTRTTNSDIYSEAQRNLNGQVGSGTTISSADSIRSSQGGGSHTHPTHATSKPLTKANLDQLQKTFNDVRRGKHDPIAPPPTSAAAAADHASWFESAFDDIESAVKTGASVVKRVPGLIESGKAVYQTAAEVLAAFGI